MTTNNNTSRNALKITIRDFNAKAIEKGYITEDLIKSSKIDTSNQVDIMIYINTLVSRNLLTYANCDNVIFEIYRGKFPIIKEKISTRERKYYLQKKNGGMEEFHVSYNLSKEVQPLYEESIEKGGFSDRNINIVIYDIDHEHKNIIVLVPLTNENIMNKLRSIKQFDEYKSTEDRNRQPINNYSIAYYIAPIVLLTKIHQENTKVSDKISQRTEVLGEQKKDLGFAEDTSKDVKIIGRDGNELDGMLSDIFDEQQKKGASDIHFEPHLGSGSKDTGQVRLRIDGVLTEPYPIQGSYAGVVRSLKVLANMSVQVLDLPQDGKIIVTTKGNERLNYRVSTMPIGENNQEKVVLRSLSTDISKLELDKLGMDQNFRHMLDNTIGNPKKHISGKYNNGMILMTGPTGSGKTTSLFAILNQLNTHYVNIQTLEDPIEYELPGINQSQISDVSTTSHDKEHYDYARGLRAILRQDPDIILVGEIRDEVTMEVAQDAATTGHLLFSSLHTNNTWETLGRMIGLGFDIHMLGNIVRLIMAQRLARKICPHCILEYDNERLAEDAKDHQERIKKYRERKLEIYKKLIDSPYMELLPDKVSDLKLYEGEGCIECFNEGNQGRIGIYEFMPISINIQNFLVEHGSNAPKDKVRELFIEEGIITLYQNAMYKTFHGKENKKGGRDYISYNNAITSIGEDMFGFGDKYKDYNTEQLETLLANKKKMKKLEKIKEKFKDLQFELKIEIDRYKNTTDKQHRGLIKNKIEKLKAEILELKKIIDNSQNQSKS